MDQAFFSRLNVVLQGLPPYSGALQTPLLTAPVLIAPQLTLLIICRAILIAEPSPSNGWNDFVPGAYSDSRTAEIFSLHEEDAHEPEGP